MDTADKLLFDIEKPLVDRIYSSIPVLIRESVPPLKKFFMVSFYRREHRER